MKHFKSFLLLPLCSFLFNCNSLNEPDTRVNLPNSIDLKGETVKLNIKLLNPHAMVVSGNKLIIFDDVQTEIFKVFELPELVNLFNWGNKGKGPEEFLLIDDNYFITYNNGLELLDNGTLKHLELLDHRLKVKSTVQLPILENPINRIQRINDSILFADNIFSDDSNEHLILNLNTGTIINKFGNYPENNLNINRNDVKYQIYTKSNIANPDLERFVVFYNYFGNIKIYNKNGELRRNIFLDDKEIKTVSTENRDQNRTYFASPYATDNYFYILRINKTDDEILEDIDNFKPELLVWDWDGNLIHRYKLDKPIIRYAISEKYQKLYGSFVTNEDEIYVVNLPDL